MTDKISFKQAVIAMEQKIATLYERAAERASDPKIREVLLFLAEQEREHENHFASISENGIALADLDRAFEEAGDSMTCFNALGSADPPEFSNPHEALRHAIACEKDSIVFYHSMLRHVEDPEVLAALNEVINEEYDHLEKTGKLLSIMIREKK